MTMDWKCAVDDEAVRILPALPLQEGTKLMDAIRGIAAIPRKQRMNSDEIMRIVSSTPSRSSGMKLYSGRIMRRKKFG